MAPQPTQKRQYSPAELAMLDDIGAGRVDTLPLQDNGVFPRNAAAMSSMERGRTGTNNKWNQAIAGGLFDDDDAAMVAGQDELANGQLARMRRAAGSSSMGTTMGLDFNDRRLRQNRSGQVAPRAQFFHPQRGPSRAGQAHNGDGPVEVRGALSSSLHAPASSPASNASARRPASSSTNGTLPPGLPKPPGLSQHSLPRAQALDGPLRPTQAAIVPSPSSAPQEQAQNPSKTLELKLPSGYSVRFQARAIFASPTFLDRIAEYPGTIYLVSGPATVGDQIILHIDEDRVEDVKRRACDYVDYLSDTDRLILQFKNESGRLTWFVAVFHQRDIMVSVVNALRDFVNSPKEANPGPAAASQVSTTVNTPAVLVDISQEASPSQVTESKAPATVSTPAEPFEPPRTSTASMAAVPEQQDATNMAIPVVILDDIVSWTMDIVAFVRDSGPAELANSDALPGIIRGASAAVLVRKHAGFIGLDRKQRVDFIIEVCAPQVFERFKRRMLENAAKQQTAETATAIAPSTQEASHVQAATPSQPPAPSYTIQQLMQLESAAAEPPDFLTELRYLPEMTSATRNLIQQIIRRANGMHDTSSPAQAPKSSQRAAHRALHTGPAKAGCGLDGQISPARTVVVDSDESDTGPSHIVPGPQPQGPAITVTGPDEIPVPEEPLISISGEMYGLNSSRHNKNGVDRLGQSAGQFTGSVKSNPHLKDLMLIDNVEDIDMSRNDPEIADIADRFARIHFNDGRTA
ncbi:hypothetical protein Daus18300_007095 [Diaporthe australafricana]|uniref:Uncharacterized protein n=1 Tax=Diaporthe australafricana TaxID=127596 RepID=A0ABR3WPY0_9PEZI